MLIRKVHWKTEEAFSHIRSGKPVVLLECPMIYPTFSNWTFESLSEIIKEDFQCDVYVSPSQRFPYWDTAKNAYNYSFTAPTRKVSMTFKEFLLTRSTEAVGVDGEREYHYLHQSLVAEMGKRILDEYSKFSLQTAAMYKMLANWNELTHNLLLCGREGFITPLHFDEQENLFTQLEGRKRVRLFSPDYWHALYPFPDGHPQDRQSQITLPAHPGDPHFEVESDHHRFPAYAEASVHELYVDLEPGEMLYIPQYWFHQMEGLTDNISLSWWFKHSLKKNLDYKNVNVNEISLIAVRRNIESVMAHMADQGKKAQALFLSIASGRTRLPGVKYKTAPSSSSPKPSAAGNETNDTGEVCKLPSFCATDLLVVDSDAGALKLGEGEDEQFVKIAQQAVSMLETIFKENAGAFLLQVVAGRFNTF